MFKIFLLSFLLTSISCSLHCKSKIKIDELVLYYADQTNFKYCHHVNKCLELDKNSIKLMFGEYRRFMDGESGYLDCYYVYQITKELGEDDVLLIIDDFKESELQVYKDKLKVGLEYESLKNKSVEEHFPKIFKMIEIKINKKQ
jgi:hypothetical protein